MTLKAARMAEPYIDTRVLGFIKPLSTSSAILDIAAGQGYLSELLSNQGFSNLHCADLDPTNFKLSKKTFHFKTVDANQPLPYKTHAFNAVISSETIEHLENPRQFLKEVYRLLKPKGLFILTTPSVENIISRLYFLATGRLAFHTDNDYRLSGHITVLPQWLLERFTRDLGFKLLQKTYSSFYLPLVKMRFPQKLFHHPFWGWVVIYQFRKP